MDLVKQIYATLKVLKWVFIQHIPKSMSEDVGIDIKAVWRIKSKCIDDCDVIIATAWCTAYDVWKLEESKGEKVYFIQGLELWDNDEKGRLSYKLPLKKITIANWIKERLINEIGCGNESIQVIFNGIDTTKFNNEVKKYNHSGPIKCLMLDHTLPNKGVYYGVDAFLKAKECNSNLTLTMFGLKKSNQVPDDAEYFMNPSIEQIIKLYREADIFIFPSVEEGWGLTPIEAMACKCALVASKAGCMLDIGKDGVNAILCDPMDSNAMKEGILKLSEDCEFRKTIAENGHHTVQSLDWNNSSIKFAEALKQIVKEHV